MPGSDKDSMSSSGSVEDGAEPRALAANINTSSPLPDDMSETDGAPLVEETAVLQDGPSFGRYHELRETGAIESPPPSPLPTTRLDLGSPEGSISTPDDTPSIQGSILSSPGRSSTPLSFGALSRNQSSSLLPFDRRFSSRSTLSPSQSPLPIRPGLLASSPSRTSSLASQLLRQVEDTDSLQAPWEVIRWTKLKQLSGQVFSEVGKRNFGKATCMSVAASLVIGTSKGYILVFDYHQTLKSIIGPGTKAVESGAISSLAISADHSTVAGGHVSGHIFTWDLARPAKPFLHIEPLDRENMDNRRSDGHIQGSVILHLGFLGTRHTALVSADDGGMAFSHLATRGLGAMGRTMKTARLLGRYPASAKSIERPRKPSSVLAFAPLPLGNVEQPTDGLGLTALLTPYLLVIVSTTPIAQTQHKASRPKDIAPHSTLSGCLAWFPAVKLKRPQDETQPPISKTKLVYCWSNILTILDVDIEEAETKDAPPQLHYRPRSRWRAEEAIVAVQWLSRSVLGVLTISQRLYILEDNTLRVTDSFDLIHKHIFHQDLFSKQLRTVVEQLDETDVSMHGVIADAFHISYKAYKGRLFLLGFNDVSIGTLSNWADRLLALMEDGDFIGAVELATSYYNGDTDKLTVGLPDDDSARHSLVQGKLIEMISASLKYTSARLKGSDGLQKNQNGLRLVDLAATTLTACMSMQEMDFLFEDVYEAFEEGDSEHVFFEALEPYIMDGTVVAIPPVVLKELISSYVAKNRADRIEEMICRLNTDTMDIHQVTTLCKQYLLYDALIYVWTQSLGDFVTPLIELLSIIKILGFDSETSDLSQSRYMDCAMKVFPYLAYSLTGRIYPSGDTLSASRASEAKASLFSFILAGKCTEWPEGSGDIFLTQTDRTLEPPFPYLQLILQFDSASFLSMLNEVFEDSHLNGDQAISNGDHTPVNSRQNTSTRAPTRQYITNILLRVMMSDDYEIVEKIYLYIFLARNLPKFPQYIMLPGTTLHNVLVGLCDYPREDLKDDCQLSVEYLLSVYHPTDMESLMGLFQRANYYRVLKSVYRGSREYSRLLETYLDDAENQDDIFGCIIDCLKPKSGLIKRQVMDIHEVIVTRAREIADIDAFRFALSLKGYAVDLLPPVLKSLPENGEEQYHFLRALFEPEAEQPYEPVADNGLSTEGFLERYVQLMCKYNSGHVADFINLLNSGDLRLEPILPALEQSGVIDAAVVLMARDGLVREAMDRLVKHLSTLEVALASLITAAAESPDTSNTLEAVEDLLAAVEKYCSVGIWLCQSQTRDDKSGSSQYNPSTKPTEEDLQLGEVFWLDLIDAIVNLSRSVTSAASQLDGTPEASRAIDLNQLTGTLRSAIHQTFSTLLATATAQGGPPQTASQKTQSKASNPAARTAPPHPSFLRILRAFLIRASRSSPSLSDLRSVLSEIFSAYTFEETILSLANRFLDKDAFSQVLEAQELRQRGWRPRGQVCETCRKRAWGPGAGGDIWDAWERKECIDAKKRARARVERRGGEEARRLARGKGRAEVETSGGDAGGSSSPLQASSDSNDSNAEDAIPHDESHTSPLIVFACRHIFHRRCLVGDDDNDGGGGGGGGGNESTRARTALVCPICAASSSAAVGGT